jgi:uncharacterized protein
MRHTGTAMIEARTALRPAVLAAALSFFLVLPACGETPEATLVIDTGSGNVEIGVELADTLRERSRGLMGREELATDAGMVFLVPEPAETPFWMKDTLIPLSVAFWDRAGRIFRIVDMEPCREDTCRYYEPGAPWVGAVEVNQGFFEERGVAEGDVVRLEGQD